MPWGLGFGIYRKPDQENGTGFVQMFMEKNLWRDIGYAVEKGELAGGERVVLGKKDASSPKYIENHSPLSDLLVCKTFDSKKEQDEWVAKQIISDIRNENLMANDIIVINPNPLSARQNVGTIRQILFREGIQSHVTGCRRFFG